MRHYTYGLNNHNIDYYQKGRDPNVLFVAGLHGDEAKIIGPLTEFLHSSKDNLPDFIYIAQMSPSAVAASTRTNNNGLDLNRHFLPGATDPEITAMMSFLTQLRFQVAIEFHEDTEVDEFYFYDSNQLMDSEIQKIREHLVRNKIKLYNGIDDENDEILGNNIIDGYLPYSPDSNPPDNGFFSDWLIENRITRRVFTVEVPQSTSDPDKIRIIHSFTNNILQVLGIT